MINLVCVISISENLTCRKFRQVRQEGKRMVEREIPMYNLDMITPFFMPLRQSFTLFYPFVADPPIRRNNSKKILAKSLESAKTRLTFATSKDSFLFHIA